MGKYLEIAQRALEKHSPSIAEAACRAKDESGSSKAASNESSGRCELSELCELTVDELREALGDDWDSVKNDPEQVNTIRRCVTEARQIEKGIVPDAYTCITTCKFCGPVFVYSGYPNPSNNCPWCFNRLKGLPIPKGE